VTLVSPVLFLAPGAKGKVYQGHGKAENPNRAGCVEQGATVTLPLMKHLDTKRRKEVKKNSTCHDAHRRKSTQTVQAGAIATDREAYKAANQGEYNGGEQKYRNKQLCRADDTGAPGGEPLAESFTQHAPHPESYGFENMSCIRVPCEFVGQGKEENFGYPGGDQPAEDCNGVLFHNGSLSSVPVLAGSPLAYRHRIRDGLSLPVRVLAGIVQQVAGVDAVHCPGLATDQKCVSCCAFWLFSDTRQQLTMRDSCCAENNVIC